MIRGYAPLLILGGSAPQTPRLGVGVKGAKPPYIGGSSRGAEPPLDKPKELKGVSDDRHPPRMQVTLDYGFGRLPKPYLIRAA